MKSSGIEWIGDIPDDWSIVKIKHIGKLIGGSGFPEEYQGINGEEIPFIKVKSLVENPITREGKDSISELTRLKLKAEKIVKGSIVFAKVGAALLLQRFRVLEFDSCIDNNMMAFVPISINSIYFKYVTSLFDFSYFVNPGTVPSINQEQVGNINIPYPPLVSQQKIADYLDEKCGEIDKTIEKQKKSIEKLKAYKQSLISETVTKGLNKSTPLKPSGIDYIGDIPTHWGLIKAKFAFNVFSGATPKIAVPEYWSDEIVWITPAEMGEYIKIISSSKRMISKLGLNSCGTTVVPKNSLILSNRASIGQVCIAGTSLCTNQGCKTLVPKIKLSYLYFYYQLLSKVDVLNMLGNGTIFMELSTSDLLNFKLILPPIEEQISIATYLENRCAEIDSTINKKQNLIEKLDAYKKSLIFEKVRGKNGI